MACLSYLWLFKTFRQVLRIKYTFIAHPKGVAYGVPFGYTLIAYPKGVALRCALWVYYKKPLHLYLHNYTINDFSGQPLKSEKNVNSMHNSWIDRNADINDNTR
jgi:hypothetical protein